jgi:biopolymer transport protein ExbD
MKFRKKHKGESGEVFTDSLNDILFILLMFFLIVATIANPNIKKVHNPSSTKDTKAKQNIVISIDQDQNFFLAHQKIDPLQLDSIITREVERVRKNSIDTPTIVINADTSAHYGGVFRIINIGSRAKARVVTMVGK